MSRSSRSIRSTGSLGILVGGALIATGITVWRKVAAELTQQKITVAPDSPVLAGKPVRGPLTAYAQAEIINTHAQGMTDGKTFAELPQDDPKREIVMTASFLRASLFTSVVSFGVSAFAIGVGAITALYGSALRKTAR